MLCPMSTGKSGSNWLDRLRSLKGFPADRDLSLEQFLINPSLSNSSSDTKSPDSTTTNDDPSPNTDPTKSQSPVLDPNPTTEIPPGNGNRELFCILSNVLSELFNMGESKNIPRAKSSRKQPNPKNCVVSNSPNLENIPMENAPSPSRVNVGAFDGEEEEDTWRSDLSAFSRTEVTVIDTSCVSWKFEKMLYRRKNVWKVRDKKGNKGMINIGKKKRKANTLLSINTKKSKYSLGHCNSSLNVPSNEGPDQTDRVEESRIEGRDVFSQIPKMRFPRKLKKGSSSVILIKSIPTMKKDGRSNPKSIQK